MSCGDRFPLKPRGGNTTWKKGLDPQIGPIAFVYLVDIMALSRLIWALLADLAA